MTALAARELGPTRRLLPFRILRAVVLAAVGCEAFYLVVMNLFLSTPLFEKAIDATPDVVDIHYTRGWSFFPTRIHARGLSIRGTDSHVEWILRFDEITFDCTLRELAKMKFHVTGARGNGITFRARLKIAAPEATAEALEYLPPIDSLGPVAFIPSLPPYPGEWDDKKWHLWTVQIDDAIAEHVREVWIEGGRFQGDARVAGSFLLKPMRAARVGPARVDVRRGSAAFDARTVLEPLVAGIDFNLEQFDPRTASGMDILRNVTLAVDAETAIPDLDNLGLTLPDSGQISGRVELPRLAVRLAKGVVRDDTRVDAKAESLRVTTAAHVISGGVDLTAAVAHDRLAAHVSLARLKGDFELSVPHMTVSADSAALDLQDPFTDLHGVLEVPDAELPRAADLAHYLPKDSPVRISRGALRASVRVEGWRAEKRVRANVSVRAANLEATGDGVLGHGDVSASAAVLFDDGSVSGTLDARAPALGVAEGSRRLDLDLTAHVRAHEHGAHTLSLDEGHVVGTHLVFSDGASEAKAAVARFSMDVAGQVIRRVARGTGTIEASGVRAATAKIHLAGDLGGVIRVARWNLEDETVDGDVSLAVVKVTGGFGAGAAAPDFVADRINVDASSPALDLRHPSMRGVDYGLHVGRAELVDARTLDAFLPSPGILAVESGQALVSADIRTSGAAHAASGHVLVSLGDGGIRLRQTHLAGDFALDVNAHGFDPDRAVVDLEGSHLAMRNVRVTGASTDTSAWSGNLVLQAGTLGLAPVPRLEGDLTLEARDANPILGVLFRDTLPAFVAQLAQMPSFTAVTHVLVEPERLVVSDLVASGGNLSLRGTYVTDKGDRVAAFVVQKGPWSVGVNLDDTGSHIRLFGLDHWYAERARQALAPR